MTFRKFVFWLHLLAGVIAGAVILVMSLTGTALAFEKEIIAWAERDMRTVTPPADPVRQSIDQLLQGVRKTQPDALPSSLTVFADPQAAVLVSFGRTNAVYVNPYTEEIRRQATSRIRAFMQVMIEWHRWLGRPTSQRTAGKNITGACNAAFLVLACTGLYLWLPRQWSRTAFRAIMLFNFRLGGKARDWNWHNVIGFWSAPVLIVLTATALPISYRWAGDLIYQVTGSEPPATGAGPGAATGPPVELPTHPAGTRLLELDALLAASRAQVPGWEQITLRLRSSSPRGGGMSPSPGSNASESATVNSTSTTNSASRGRRGPDNPDPPSGSERRDRNPGAVQPVMVTIKERDGWPRFATVQLTMDPFTGAVLRRDSFADYNLGRRIRSWSRFLHTGEALGTPGKAVAGLASLAGSVLVWTGLTLAWRRWMAFRAGLSPQNVEPPRADPWRKDN